MFYKLNEGTVESRFEGDDYIPMNICFGKEDLDVDRMGLYGPDGDLIEIASSMATHEIRELTLVHCGEYSRVDGKVTAPHAKSGVLTIQMADHVDVPRFKLEVFSNGLRFEFDDGASDYLQCGAVAFGFSNARDAISEVYVLDLNAGEIDAIVETLEFHREQKDAVIAFEESFED